MYNGPMKALLVIGYVWPEPKSSAAGSRMLQLLATFQTAGYHITYASPAEFSPHSVDLKQLNIDSCTIQLNSSSFDDFLIQLKPDAVLFDRFMMEEQFGWRVEKHCPTALRLLDTEDLHSLRHARHQVVKQKRSVRPSDLNNELAQREISAIFRCDLTFMISEFEMALLIDHYKVDERLIHYCPFMIDMDKVQKEFSLDFSERQHFISIGNFRHEPNWDAVRYLKESLWPAIRKQLPSAELHIYGGYPPKKATQLHNDKQGFLVKGWAEDAHDVIGKSRVLLAPLRFGAGLKGKLIDAAICQTPAVTTEVGGEGMYGKSSTIPARISSNDTDFIEKAVDLYQNEEQWNKLSQAGQQSIRERFNKDAHEKNLLSTLSYLEQNIDEHRSSNFIGSMLRHHSMKSTQYMSQWIEAKNQLKK